MIPRPSESPLSKRAATAPNREVPTTAARAPSAGTTEGELRCDCGCLLARRHGDRLELKCRRCKRVVGVALLISIANDCGCEKA